MSVEVIDGLFIRRLTGGMAYFMSSITVDLDSGVAAFASINAMRGYRPVPVTQFAVQLMNAEKQGKTGPAPPELNDPREVKNASDFAGVFEASGGGKLHVVAAGSALSIVAGDKRIPLE